MYFVGAESTEDFKLNRHLSERGGMNRVGNRETPTGFRFSVYQHPIEA
jgi:hypothetical protein